MTDNEKIDVEVEDEGIFELTSPEILSAIAGGINLNNPPPPH